MDQSKLILFDADVTGWTDDACDNDIIDFIYCRTMDILLFKGEFMDDELEIEKPFV